MLINELPINSRKILLEDISWYSQYDQESFIGLRSLVKNNNGVFKSIKQRDFMLENLPKRIRTLTDASKLKSEYDISFDPSKEKMAAITLGSMRFGRMTNVNIGYVFILDSIGVTKQYKLKWKLSGGRSIQDPAGTVLEWTRPTSGIDSSALVDKDPIPADTSTSQGGYIGQPDDRIKNLPVTIERITGPFIRAGIQASRHAATEYYVNQFRDDKGNVLFYFGSPLGYHGHKFEMTFTVKRHDKDKKTGAPYTVISRPIVKDEV
jgi:hypothetical protein